jgi:hypothetical protein
MAHFLCTNCKEEIEYPGFCQTPDCPQFGQALDLCECEDGKHGGLKGGEGEESLDGDNYAG